MNSYARSLALALGIVLLIMLRLLPEYDPIAEIVSNFTKNSHSPTVNVDDVKLMNLKLENEQLKSELNFVKSNPDSDYVAANVINKTTASFRLSLKINRGSNEGIKNDQPVFTNGILIGIISNTEPNLATVLLIGDPDVQIPVVIGSAQGLVKSQAGGVIVDRVVGMGRTDQDKPVLSSGLGGLYPPGLIVGKLGAKLPRDVFDRYVLDTPINLADIKFVMVKLK